jgi:hypothetical protein
MWLESVPTETPRSLAIDVTERPGSGSKSRVALSSGAVPDRWSWCRMGPQRRAWRIFNRPSPMVPEIRILGPPGRERRRGL